MLREALGDGSCKWSAEMAQVIATGNISYAELQAQVVSRVADFNKKAAATALILSDSVFVFSGKLEIVSTVDQKMLLASLNDLRVQVANISLMVQ